MRPPRYHYDGRDARSDDFDFFEPPMRRDFSPPRGRPLSPRRPLLSPRRGPFHAHNDVYRSRYGGGRFDGPGDRRSRSPRDRSPYHDRPSQFNDPDRRRSDSRPNSDLFPGPDTFRGPSMTGRDPPRGPKALLDRPLEPPSGPRGGGGFRGRGGRGGGRGWSRDDSRDRGRERDFDPRDRPPPFRDERSRERDRDWVDRDRDGPPRDGFRNRRLSPPPPRGRGRSPPIGRDFRDSREPPVGIDVDRARRGSRDGPLSAGSSNSDPPFGSGYRGGFGRGADRGGRGRGRGDYDRGRGGRGGYHDDRDRFISQRSRSHDRGGGGVGGGWGRGRDDRDDRDRFERYPPDTVRFPARKNDRGDLIRDRPRDDAGPSKPAPERPVSREPSIATTRDKSPPPLAPSAAAFGSMPNRKPSIADIPASLTGKPPPTGPRALATEDKSVTVPASLSVQQPTPSIVKPLPPPAAVPAERVPPTGPSSSKPILAGSPPIPIGPRAQQIAAQKGQAPMAVVAPRQHHNNQGIARSSKQWINPNKNVPPESPSGQKSQSFVSHPGKPPIGHRPQSSHSDHHPDHERRGSHAEQHAETERPRPRSSDGHPERHAPTQEFQQRRFAGPARYYEGPTGPNAVPLPRRDTKHPPTGRASVERDIRRPKASDELRENRTAEKEIMLQAAGSHDVQSLAGSTKDSKQLGSLKPGAERPGKVTRPRWKKSHISIPAAMVTYNPKNENMSVDGDDDSVDSEDEDMEQYFDKEIDRNQADVDKFTRADEFDTGIPLRYASQTCQASVRLALMEEGIREAVQYHEPGPLSADAADDAITENVSTATGTEVTSTERDGPDSRPAELSVGATTTPITIGNPASDALAPKQVEEPDVDMAAASSGAVAEPVQPPSAEPTVPEVDAMDIDNDHEVLVSGPQPKTEEADPRTMALQPSVSKPVVDPEDADMLDAPGEIDDMPPPHTELGPTPAINGSTLPVRDVTKLRFHVAEEDQLASRRTSVRTTPDPADADAEGEEEDDDATEIEEIDFTRLGDFRRYMPTPPLDELPDFGLPPWCLSKKVHKAYEMPEGLGDAILAQMNDEHLVKSKEQADKRDDYRDKYEKYLRFTMSNDPVAIKSRNYLSGGTTTIGSGKAATSAEERKEGGRRAPTRFATELDLNLAIQQSIQEENERREREERARQEKYRSEKEAVIPDMYWNEEERKKEFYVDRSGYLPVEKLVDAWQVLPPINNFTEEEADLFEKAFLEFPKQWGKIAEQVPNRDFRACIQYYYSSKKEQNYKAKLKKQPKKRKPKGRKQKATSELGNAENETETQEETVGENGERRRPRRAAAPTWGYEQTPAVDSDGNTPAATPSRGRKNNSSNDNGTEKPEAKARRRRAPAKDKGEKAAAKASALAQAQAQAQAQTQAQTQVQTQVQGHVQQVLAPSPAPGTKANRSRSSSRANNPAEWGQSPNDMARLPARFEAPTASLQPSMPPPAPQPTLASPSRVPMSLTHSTISEVMAPPSLRPEPPPPPANLPTFDSFTAVQPGPDRTRTPAQASSYWSVSETTDFPNLLRSFGTDWQAIANYMKTKTTVMVKNYYLRSKDNGKPEWERIAMEADEQLKRGEKRPPPPPLTPAPTRGKRFDPSSAGNTPLTGHRTLAAAEPLPDEMTGQAKMESPGPGPSIGAPPPYAAKFQVPIAQAPVNQTPPPLGPATARAITPQHQQMHAQQQPIQHPREQHAVPQLMSPGGHAVRPPVASFAYPERDEPPLPLSQPQHQPHARQQSAKPGQAVRVSHMAGPGQGPIPVSTVSSPGLGPVSQPPVTETMSSRAMWAVEGQHPQLSQPSHMGQFPTQPRDAYDRPARMLESQLREAPRRAERAPVRLKQEPELVSPYDSPFTPMHQQPQRVGSARQDPSQHMLRQHQPPDPHRTVAPGPTPEQQQRQQQHLYGNTSAQQPPTMRNFQGESGINLQPQPAERPTLGIKPTPMAASRHDPYAAATTPLVQQAHLDPLPNQPPPTRPPQEPRKTSNLFALLNDDPPAPPPPKRANEVSAGLKPSSTPPAQGMSVRAPPPPQAASVPLRRETEPVGYGSFRNTGGPTSMMPSLKPYNVQSPQEHHSSLQRPTMGSQPNTPAAGPERGEYYPRHAYTQSQQQQQPVETSLEGSHYLSQSQHGQQQPPIGYQSQSAYSPYGSTGSQQPHSTSPAPPLSAHQMPGGPRREPGREAQPQWSHQNQQHLGLAQTQQDRNMQQPQPTGWPTTAPQLKANQSPSPWGAAHGSNHGDPPSKSSQSTTGQFPSQSSGWRESTQPPQQQQHQPLGFRDDLRGQPVFEAHSQRAPSGMIQHGHHSSLSGRYPATSQVSRRQPEAGLSPQGQPGYGRYPSSQPQPTQRDAHGQPPRSYTPVSMYDPRGPAPSSGPAAPGQPNHRQILERHPMHEMQFREMQREREVLELQQQQQQQQQQQGRIHSSGLRGGPGPNEAEVYLSRGQDRSL